ncbi:hypothetical protein ACHHYP_10060 [Achlya hypogyna]|uniref:Secreted protein n=1 Tax=Achlya hypogyna TaxID=1202772 RepID=A0A1V9ZIA7_ACHHY|nr:hypothetical protein ACHHYP_10060 [Achlya hypogyna]
MRITGLFGFGLAAGLVAASTTPSDFSNLICSVTHGGLVSSTHLSGILSFCTAFSSSRCCLPVHDEYVKSTFYAIFNAGQICGSAMNSAVAILHSLHCAACNPAVSLYLSPPKDNVLFTTAQSLKVCSSLALLSDVQYTDSTQQSAPSSFPEVLIVIAPAVVFPGCEEGKYVCYSSSKGAYSPVWYCSDSPCGVDTPVGLKDVKCRGHSCSAAFQFLNDNSSGKPPFFEGYPVEIIDDSTCAGIDYCCITDPTLTPP